MPVHDAFLTNRMNGVSQARRVLVRVGLFACLLVGVLCPGASTEAWDAERMLSAAKKLSPRAVAGVQALQPLLTQALDQDEATQLQNINQFFNRRILFRDDAEVWGQIDYWASPLESLDKGRGDCEDYAIAKYFSLVAAGTPVARLRMVYVRAQLGGKSLAHMVLAYYAQPGAVPLILDNLVGDVRSASSRTDLQPVFSFNTEGLWQGVGQATQGDPVARLSQWRDLLAKVREEGF